MSREEADFKKYATEYDPLRIGSIDGTDSEPHDRGIARAMVAQYAPNKMVRGTPLRTLFVGRLNPRTTEDTVKSEFTKFGKVVHCRLVKDLVTGKSKQYAFVELESGAAADRALHDMHMESIDGTQVIVEREAERRLPGWRPRRLGGGFGGQKGSGQLRFGCAARPWRRPLRPGAEVAAAGRDRMEKEKVGHTYKKQSDCNDT